MICAYCDTFKVHSFYTPNYCSKTCFQLDALRRKKKELENIHAAQERANAYWENVRREKEQAAAIEEQEAHAELVEAFDALDLSVTPQTRDKFRQACKNYNEVVAAKRGRKP